MRFTYLLLFSILIYPPFAFASVSITEIMYDPKDSDTDREWIEVYNDGADIDLSQYKFSEGGTNHSLIVSQGGTTLKNDDYAVIADNPQKFLIDFPTYTGIIFDSSFSLNNTGETLIIKDKNLVEIDKVVYNSLWGGAGDGSKAI